VESGDHDVVPFVLDDEIVILGLTADRGAKRRSRRARTGKVPQRPGAERVDAIGPTGDSCAQSPGIARKLRGSGEAIEST